ncbi:transcriptional regulator [Streptomyces agglomeratus]|uniref:Transcriptional regulator n=1 Tax=Streptomyces agglomeratus TaxID=285458 RepID=A0A1E5PGF2_9ACTN|nr:MerR family transcriptional regulator [Streptomyces agglomeratus]OEJ28601.1 transcriptional regulator [Streptomyces agglomeratus]OEJ37334.1 transcriptional regulator [Streptomyces agglomeratus]OEJ48284.1 transcriptional regulator [Streptomyces agglomeratus]OEJ49877.1 transcriptional regulator [Streptomyces agglomeratus]OEJ57206.1 transcriptional regulator [Streptomyces agglomeratus]
MDETEGSRPETGGLTTGAVARRFGVAPTTLRSWDRRYGIGPAAREDGKHRRWTAADLAVLERMRALTHDGVPPAEAARVARAQPRPEREPTDSSSGRTPGTAAARRRGSPTTRPVPRGHPGGGLQLKDARVECRGLARAALRLDAFAVDRLLEAVIAEHGLVTAWAEIIVPTLRAVGRKWQTSGEKYVEVEHLLSWHVSSALHRRQRAPAEVSTADFAVLACVPGETHTLPLEALAAALHERNLPVRMFGAALPAEALVEAVRRTGPGAVALWAQSRTTASRPLAQHVARMTWGVRGARRRPTVLTVGPGWTAPVVPGALRPSGLAEAVDAVVSVLTGRPGGPSA